MTAIRAAVQKLLPFIAMMMYANLLRRGWGGHGWDAQVCVHVCVVRLRENLKKVYADDT
jgi:hypothetical protein